jgi:GntR family phosphonate transport system transcriptional regulator
MQNEKAHEPANILESAPLWRRIESAVRREILEGQHPPGTQLPSDRQIAAAHGASRMTARRALAALEQDGLIRIEHGSGTFVNDDALVRYRMSGDRIRFGTDWIVAEGTLLRRKVMRTFEQAADAKLAQGLRLIPGDPVLCMQIAAFADDRPISIGIRHCDARRFKGLQHAFEREGSITAALKTYGVEDYRRASTDVTARMPTLEEARLLAQPRLQPVLAYTAIDVDVKSGAIVSYHLGCFAADRVVISIGGDSD